MRSICVALVAALVLVSCAGTSDSAAGVVVVQPELSTRSLGESGGVVCFDSADSGHGYDPAGFVSGLAGLADAWVEVSVRAIEPTTGDERDQSPFIARLDEDIEGFATNAVYIDSGLARLKKKEFESLLLPVMIDELPEANVAVAIGAFVPSVDGTWQAVLACHNRTFEALHSWAAKTDRGKNNVDLADFNLFLANLVGFGGKNQAPRPNDALVAELVADIGFKYDESALLSWGELSPLDRSLHDAPDEVLVNYENELLLIRLPKAWHDQRGATICTRTPTGWNPCFSSDFKMDESDLIPLEALRGKGESLEITISPADELSRLSPQVLVTIDSADLDAATESLVEIVTDLAPAVAARGPQAIRADVQTGTDLLSE